jgi:hypothetical protein
VDLLSLIEEKKARRSKCLSMRARSLILICCEHLQEIRAEIQETAFFPYLPPGKFLRASSKTMSKMVRRYMFKLLQHDFVTQPRIFSEMDAVAIWLAL